MLEALTFTIAQTNKRQHYQAKQYLERALNFNNKLVAGIIPNRIDTVAVCLWIL